MFIDRFDAGKRLAKALERYKGKKDAIILAIPRGALQIGQVLHDELKLPLDIIITKKISHPMQEEYAIGAIGPGGIRIINDEAAREVPREYLDNKIREISASIEEKYKRYRGNEPVPVLKGKIVILVDDGIATGSTMIAAIRIVRRQRPKSIIVAVPVAPADSLVYVKAEADEVICLETPSIFYAIGQFYDDFVQVEDEEAIMILKRCRK